MSLVHKGCGGTVEWTDTSDIVVDGEEIDAEMSGAPAPTMEGR